MSIIPGLPDIDITTPAAKAAIAQLGAVMDAEKAKRLANMREHSAREAAIAAGTELPAWRKPAE